MLLDVVLLCSSATHGIAIGCLQYQAVLTRKLRWSEWSLNVCPIFRERKQKIVLGYLQQQKYSDYKIPEIIPKSFPFDSGLFKIMNVYLRRLLFLSWNRKLLQFLQ